jgi:glutathione S-transferase
MVPYICLTEAGATFDVQRINMRKQQQMTPEYMALNPKHKVPLLVVDGRPLTENTAINTWVHRTFPAARLLPADPWAELEALSLMSWCASGIHPFLTRINSPVKVCDTPGSEDSVKRAATEALLETFGIADAKLKGREFFFDHFTVPDAHFFWCCRRAAQFGIDLKQFPAVSAHHERLLKRPSVAKLIAFEQATQDAFAKAA